MKRRPCQSCGSWTLLLCKCFLLFQWICIDAGHVSENTLLNEIFCYRRVSFEIQSCWSLLQKKCTIPHRFLTGIQRLACISKARFKSYSLSKSNALLRFRVLERVIDLVHKSIRLPSPPFICCSHKKWLDVHYTRSSLPYNELRKHSLWGESEVILYSATIEWGRVGCEELCRSLRITYPPRQNESRILHLFSYYSFKTYSSKLWPIFRHSEGYTLMFFLQILLKEQIICFA